MRLKLLFIICAAFPFLAHAQCLSGVYTIGGVAPDYATITAAVNDLNTNGVCGPVTFNIRNGTYTEQVTIDTITGGSAVNRVVFQSESMDSSLVTVNYTGASGFSFVFRLLGASHVTIRNITLTNLSAQWSGLICLTGNADSISINNNRLLAPNSTTSNTTCSQIYTVAITSDSILIANNYMQGGCYGVYAGGDSDMVITNNIFVGQYGTPVNLRLYNRCIVTDNRMSSTSTAFGYEGIFLISFDDSVKVLRNIIDSPKDGITVDNMSCPVSAPAIISGNIVRVTGTGYALRVDDNSFGVHYSFNTAQANGTASVFRTEDNLSDIVLNSNILHSAGTGYIYFNFYEPIEFTSDNNVLYCSGPIASINTVPSTSSLLTWRLQYNLDLSSIMSLPQYVSPTNLHIAADFAQNMFCPVSVYDYTDVDGDLRNISHPYPGADEFTHSIDTSDAGTLFIRADRFAPCSSTHPVKVTIRNYGSDTLSSVTLNWTLNGLAQPAVIWTGALLYWDTLQVLLANVPTTSNQTFDIHAWTTLPNGNVDPTLVNDTLARGTVHVGLSGLYTIGGATPSFTTITAAVAALNTRGVCGPVNMCIRLGNYSGKYILDSIHGSSAVNTIRFYSEFGDSSTVRLYSNTATSTSNYVFQLRGTDYITFEDLTIEAGSTSYSNCFRLNSAATHVTITNCEIKSINAAATEANGSVILNEDASVADGYFTVKNSLISGGHSGLVMRSSAPERGGLVDNIVFSNQTYASLVMRAQNDCIVNKVMISNPVNGQTRGIWLDQINDSVTIQNCRIYGNIRDGIMMFNNLTKIVVINNFISVGSVVAVPPTTHAIGISQSAITFNADEYLIAFNSASIYSSGNNANDAALYIYTTTDTVVATILNNNLNCEGTGAGMSFTYGAWMGTCNYNNIFSGKIGVNQTNVYTTLATWQALGFDANSISLNPLFLSVSDLHTYQIALGNAGTPIAGITSDIDGDLRASSPYIGADEANPILDITPLSGKNNIQVYPNPAHGNCIVNVQSQEAGTFTLEIVNIHGQVVQNTVHSCIPGSNTVPVSLENYSAGYYFVRVTINAESNTCELLITE